MTTDRPDQHRGRTLSYLPVFMDTRHGRVVIVGGGEAAVRKARLVLKSGAEVSVVAPGIGEAMGDLVAAGAVDWVARRFEAGDVAGRLAVYAATGLDDVDRLVARSAQAARVPVNVVDRPDHSTFITPAIVDRSPLIVAVSSAGKAPVLARNVRLRIESLLPARLGRLAEFAERFRPAVMAMVPEGLARLRFWDRFFDGPIADAVLDGDEQGAAERMLAVVNRRAPEGADAGTVYIVGAGPGDPDLLTFKAHRLLQRADVIVYDRLVGDGVVDLARRDAERIFVGKHAGAHSRTQDEINDILVAQAAAGKRVVRLKGGDPFVFGRGGEEAEVLRAHGYRVEVVPGITAATACAASAGIPLTHRDASSAVTLVTGHGKAGAPDVDWRALAGAGHTLAVYMGVGRAAELSAEMRAGGLAAETPVAVVENGTTAHERTVVTTVAGLPGALADEGITGPALILVGDVVGRRMDRSEAAPRRAAAMGG